MLSLRVWRTFEPARSSLTPLGDHDHSLPELTLAVTKCVGSAVDIDARTATAMHAIEDHPKVFDDRGCVGRPTATRRPRAVKAPGRDGPGVGPVTLSLGRVELPDRGVSVSSMLWLRRRLPSKDSSPRHSLGLRLHQHGVGQGFKSMGPALRDLESLVLERKIRHGDHPLAVDVRRQCGHHVRSGR